MDVRVRPERKLRAEELMFLNCGFGEDSNVVLEKTLILGKTEGRRRGRQRMRWLDDISDSNGHEFE